MFWLETGFNLATFWSRGCSAALAELPHGGWQTLVVGSYLESKDRARGVNVVLIVPLVVVLFFALLFIGRAQVAKGSNAATANGATLLTLAAVVGVLALGMLVSLDVW